MAVNSTGLLTLGAGTLSGLLNGLKKSRTAQQTGAQTGTTAASQTGATASTSTANQTGTSTGTTLPVEPPGYSTLGELLRQRAAQRLMSNIDMGGLESTGIKNINQTFGDIAKTENANLTSRGLGTSPIAGAVDVQRETARGGNIADFLNSLPELQRQMQAEDFALANSFYAQRPLGTTSTTTQTGQQAGTTTGTTTGSQTGISTGTQTGTSTEPGSPIGGALSSLGGTLGYLTAHGLLTNAAKVAGPIAAATIGAPAAAATIGALPAVATPTVASLAPTFAAATAPSGVVAAPGVAPGISGSGGAAHAIASFATNPITIGVAAAIAGITALLKSQAHWEANTWVNGFQNPFDKKMDELNQQFFQLARSGQITKQQAQDIRNAAADLAQQYEQKRQQFSTQGSDKSKVAMQAKQTADQWYGPNFANFLGAMDQTIATLR